MGYTKSATDVRQSAIQFLTDFGRKDLADTLRKNPLLPASESLEILLREQTRNCSISIKLFIDYVRQHERRQLPLVYKNSTTGRFGVLK